MKEKRLCKGGIVWKIKYDKAIARTGNIYREVWEKSYTNQRWRHSKVNADAYIFVTEGFAIFVEVNELANAENGLTLKRISDTSEGFLIPLCKLNCERKEIKLWKNTR